MVKLSHIHTLLSRLWKQLLTVCNEAYWWMGVGMHYHIKTKVLWYRAMLMQPLIIIIEIISELLGEVSLIIKKPSIKITLWNRISLGKIRDIALVEYGVKIHYLYQQVYCDPELKWEIIQWKNAFVQKISLLNGATFDMVGSTKVSGIRSTKRT